MNYYLQCVLIECQRVIFNCVESNFAIALVLHCYAL